MASCMIQESKKFHKLHVIGMNDDLWDLKYYAADDFKTQTVKTLQRTFYNLFTLRT